VYIVDQRGNLDSKLACGILDNMNDFYGELFKECLDSKGAPGAVEVRMFVAPCRDNPESGQDNRVKALMSLKLYKGKRLV
jgi:hypothetical protein